MLMFMRKMSYVMSVVSVFMAIFFVSVIPSYADTQKMFQLLPAKAQIRMEGAFGTAVDSKGNLYVCNRNNYTIQKIDPQGNLILEWGSWGNGDGQFGSPQFICVDRQDNVYVADGFISRVQKFDSNGRFLMKFHGFRVAGGIAVDSAGNIFVTDGYDDNVKKFNSKGVLVSQWGTSGSEDGQFDEPCGVATDASDNVYVLDQGNSRVQIFTSSGGFISKFGAEGTENGSFGRPYAIALDKSGRIYISDTKMDCIHIFAKNHSFIGRFGSSGDGIGQFESPYGIAIDAQGNIYVADYSNVQKFSADGKFILGYGTKGGDLSLSGITDVAVKNGELYVAAQGETCIQKFDAQTGALKTTWKSTGGDTENWCLVGLDVDASGNVYAADLANHKVRIFNSKGEQTGWFGGLGGGDSQLCEPMGIAITPNGEILVLDYGNSKVKRFSKEGDYLGSIRAVTGKVDSPTAVEVDASGNIYIADYIEDEIYKYSSSGELITRISIDSIPESMTFDSAGNMYTTHPWRNSVCKYSPAGKLISTWQGFDYPEGIACDANNNIYVGDSKNNRVMKMINPLITGFSVSGQTGSSVIDENTHTVTFVMPANTDLTKLAPVIKVSGNASVSPASGAVCNFTVPVKYTVTSSDGSASQVWNVVCLTKGPDTVAPIVKITSPSKDKFMKMAKTFSTCVVKGKITDNDTVNPKTVRVFVNDVLTATLSGCYKDFSVTINLKNGKNIVRVECEDISGNVSVPNAALDTRLIGVDAASPSVSVHYFLFDEDDATDGTQTTKKGITFSGSVSDDSTPYDQLSVTVNGKKAVISPEGDYTCDVTLKPGNNPFKIVAKDKAGRKTTVIYNDVNLIETDPPVVKFIKPSKQMMLAAGTGIVVQGSVNEKSRVTLYISTNGGAEQEYDSCECEKGKKFTFTVDLPEGSNRLRLEAVDASGNKSVSNEKYDTRTVIVDRRPPQVKVTFNGKKAEAGEFTGSQKLLIEGMIKDDYSSVAKDFTVTINGKKVSAKKTDAGISFLYNYTMSKGSQTVEIIVKDKVGNVYKMTDVVIYKP